MSKSRTTAEKRIPHISEHASHDPEQAKKPTERATRISSVTSSSMPVPLLPLPTAQELALLAVALYGKPEAEHAETAVELAYAIWECSQRELEKRALWGKEYTEGAKQQILAEKERVEFRDALHKIDFRPTDGTSAWSVDELATRLFGTPIEQAAAKLKDLLARHGKAINPKEKIPAAFVEEYVFLLAKERIAIGKITLSEYQRRVRAREHGLGRQPKMHTFRDLEELLDPNWQG